MVHEDGGDGRLVPSTIESLVIDHVDRQRLAVAALAVTRRGGTHRVGHLRGEGWFCTCSRGKRCSLIGVVRNLVPSMGPPA
jgi:hypothetical protein